MKHKVEISGSTLCEVCKLELFIFVLLSENFESHVINCRIIEHYDTPVRPRFYMHGAVLSILIINTPKVIANGLNCDVEFVGNTMGASIRQAVLDSAEFVECYSFAHDKNVYEIIILKMNDFSTVKKRNEERIMPE